MRIVFSLLGAIALCGSTAAGVLSLACPHNYWIARLGGSAGAVAGSILIYAAVKGYRGHWAFVIGLTMIAFALMGLGSDLDDKSTGKTDHMDQTGMAVVTSLLTLGTLSLWSAHKLHRCTLALENRNA